MKVNCIRYDCLINEGGNCRGLLEKPERCTFYKDRASMDWKDVVAYEEGAANGFKPKEVNGKLSFARAGGRIYADK